MFSISHPLRDAINRAVVEVEGGVRCPLTLISVVGIPEHEPTVGELTVATMRGDKEYRATVGIGLSNLDDDSYVVEALVDTMRAVLSGDLKPGERRLL